MHKKKCSVPKLDPCSVCGTGLAVILLSVQNFKGGFIIVVLMCLGRRVYYRVGMSLSVEYVLVIIVQ